MKIVVAASIACLTSLSNAATDPSTLETPPTKTMKVIVPVVWQNTYGVATMQYEVVPGDYVSAHADEKGVYFRGPDPCLIQRILKVGNETPETGLKLRRFGSACGIYVEASTGAVQVYEYTRTTKIIEGEPLKPSSPPDEVVTSVGTQAVTNTNAGPAAAGLGMGIAAALIEALRPPPGHVTIIKYQPGSTKLKSAIRE